MVTREKNRCMILNITGVECRNCLVEQVGYDRD